MVLALKLHDNDNVATLLSDDAMAGDSITVVNLMGKKTNSVLAMDNIPRGHKVALLNIKIESPIVKYGEIIGRSVPDIDEGYWVHTHNIESLRGRGDLNG